MCEVSAWVAVASLVLTAAAGQQQAQAQKKAGQYQQEVSEQNAKLDDFRAGQAATLGSIREEAARAKVRQVAGSQRATLAANGIDLGSGTAVDLVSDTYTLGEADALTQRFNAMNEAWGYRTQGVNDRNSGRFARMTGNAQATGTYLSTAASLAGQAYSAYGSGAFSGKGGTTSGASYGSRTGTGPA